MASYRLSVIIKNSSNEEEFLLVRQTPPSKFQDDDLKDYVDSDLFDLPSVSLEPLTDAMQTDIVIKGAEACLDKLNVGLFDVRKALNQVLSLISMQQYIEDQWVFWDYVEEAECGPKPLIHTIFVNGKAQIEKKNLQENCRWISFQNCAKLLVDVKPCGDRIGPLTVVSILRDLVQSRKWRIPPTLSFQEYPPGIVVVPMESKTGRPFYTTNLITIAPPTIVSENRISKLAVYGEALIMDPGCHSLRHKELRDIVAALPRKLIVFVTHHHRDHIEGLSIVQKCNPEAILVAHENTIHRIGRDRWSLGYICIKGGEDICIGDQELKVIYAPGHTDGHMALLHVNTHTLVVGDHCVGQGSAVLDIKGGGNMKEYMQTTYKFMDLSPHVLIPMHGRICLWPKQMLCDYIRNRRMRESSIKKAIDCGAETLFDIVAKTYGNVDTRLWIWASSNVRLHVEHLHDQDKLPKCFSVQKFEATSGFHFLIRWYWLRFTEGLLSRTNREIISMLIFAIMVAAVAAMYTF